MRWEVAYGWGDRALFQAVFDYPTVIRRLAGELETALFQ